MIFGKRLRKKQYFFSKNHKKDYFPQKIPEKTTFLLKDPERHDLCQRIAKMMQPLSKDREIDAIFIKKF